MSAPASATGLPSAAHAHRCPPGWMPASPCDESCLPSRGAGAGVRATLRLAGVAATLLATLIGVMVLPARARVAWLARGCRALLRAAGVRVVVRGDARFVPDGGALVVANHVSWIDVLALQAVQPVRLLAKREIGEWPVIGRVAAGAGTLFVDRAGLSALPATVAEVATALRGGHRVGVFPEGTTWCGAAAGPFRRAAFQAALDAGVPVRPVALAFRRAGNAPAPAAAFVGDQTLVDSLLRVARERDLVCEVTVLPLLSPHGDRRELAARAAAAIATATGVPHGLAQVGAVDDRTATALT